LKKFEDVDLPIACLITDGSLTNDNFEDRLSDTTDTIRAAVKAGVALIQIREKQLSRKKLISPWSLCCRGHEAFAVDPPNKRSCRCCSRVWSGRRSSCGILAAGGNYSPFIPHLIVGVSTHSIGSVIAAEKDAADFAISVRFSRRQGKAIRRAGEAPRGV
jgi:hypothetical protein